MALLAEEIVEEWLNRNGYFTIRGIKIGVQEIDLLAVRFKEETVECRHIEVQASINAISYVTGVAKSIQKEHGRPANSAKQRSNEELAICVKEWVEKKFTMDSKDKIRSTVVPSSKWTYELVVNNVKHPEELEVIRKSGVTVHPLSKIISELRAGKGVIQAASGSDFVELVLLNEADNLIV